LTIAGDSAGKQYKWKKNKLHDSDTHGARLNSPFLFASMEEPKFQSVGYLVELSQPDKMSNITMGYTTWARFM
jgi:hypothetical protein